MADNSWVTIILDFYEATSVGARDAAEAALEDAQRRHLSPSPLLECVPVLKQLCSCESIYLSLTDTENKSTGVFRRDPVAEAYEQVGADLSVAMAWLEGHLAHAASQHPDHAASPDPQIADAAVSVATPKRAPPPNLIVTQLGEAAVAAFADPHARPGSPITTSPARAPSPSLLATGTQPLAFVAATPSAARTRTAATNTAAAPQPLETVHTLLVQSVAMVHARAELASLYRSLSLPTVDWASSALVLTEIQQSLDLQVFDAPLEAALAHVISLEVTALHRLCEAQLALAVFDVATLLCALLECKQALDAWHDHYLAHIHQVDEAFNRRLQAQAAADADKKSSWLGWIGGRKKRKRSRQKSKLASSANTDDAAMPTLYHWLRIFFHSSASKAALYLYSSMVTQQHVIASGLFNSPQALHGITTAEPESEPAKSFHDSPLGVTRVAQVLHRRSLDLPDQVRIYARRTGAHAVAIIYHVPPDTPFHAAGFLCQDPDAPLSPPTGVRSFPVLYAHPSHDVFLPHWPNAVATLAAHTLQPEDPPVSFYDNKLGCTYRIEAMERRVTLVTIFASTRTPEKYANTFAESFRRLLSHAAVFDVLRKGL